LFAHRQADVFRRSRRPFAARNARRYAVVDVGERTAAPAARHSAAAADGHLRDRTYAVQFPLARYTATKYGKPMAFASNVALARQPRRLLRAPIKQSANSASLCSQANSVSSIAASSSNRSSAASSSPEIVTMISAFRSA